MYPSSRWGQGVLDHHGRPGNRYDGFKAIGKELNEFGPELLGSWVLTEAAIAGADQAVTDGFTACSLGLPSPDTVAGQLHGHLYQAGYATGIVHPSDDLRDVKLLVIPHRPIFDPAWVPHLEAWVKDGGTLLIGALTGTRDTRNQIITDPAPGTLRQLAGIEIDHFERINDPAWRSASLCLSDPADDYANSDLTTEHWRESLRLIADRSDLEVLAIWSTAEPTSWMRNTPAIVRRRLGRGSVVYAGTHLTTDRGNCLLEREINWAGLAPVIPKLPKRLEAVVRTDGHTRWLFLLNTDG